VASVQDLQELAAEALGPAAAWTFRREFDQLQPLVPRREKVRAVAMGYHWTRPAAIVITERRCLVASKAHLRRRFQTQNLEFFCDRVFRINPHGGKTINTTFYEGTIEVFRLSFDLKDAPLVREICDLIEAAGGKVIAERELPS
jgi:hypothetical protein